MSKFCPNCGRENDDNAVFCINCNSALNPEQQMNQQPNNNMNNGNGMNMNIGNNTNLGIKRRDLVLQIIFTIITCGIYGIYWFVCINDDVNKASNHPEATSGVLAYIFSLITCGITYYIGVILWEKDYMKLVSEQEKRLMT